jgi:hypothetical protein
MASFNLQDAAQLWYIQIQREEGTPHWRRFTKLLNLRFGPPLRSNPLGELAACKRTGSVVDYQEPAPRRHAHGDAEGTTLHGRAPAATQPRR